MANGDFTAEDLSDSDYDELVSEDEGDDVKSKTTNPNALLKGSLQRPRHVTLNTKQIHGEYKLRARRLE